MRIKRALTGGRTTLAAAVMILIIAGASSGLSRRDLAVFLKEKKIIGLTSRGLILAFHTSIRNSSSAPCALTRYNYRVTINRKEYLRLPVSLEKPIRIEAGEEIIIALPLKITYDLLFAAVGPLTGKASCDVVGDFIFTEQNKREEKIGFAFSGEFPIFQDPAVEFLPLQVNDLTVGGADLVFAFKFSNDNDYELIVDKISFKLQFAEKTVLEGEVAGDKTIPLQGEKDFSLPFLLDFFEVGPEVREALQQASVSCRFSGQVGVQTVWGRLIIPFDQASSLRLVRRTDQAWRRTGKENERDAGLRGI